MSYGAVIKLNENGRDNYLYKKYNADAFSIIKNYYEALRIKDFNNLSSLSDILAHIDYEGNYIQNFYHNDINNKPILNKINADEALNIYYNNFVNGNTLEMIVKINADTNKYQLNYNKNIPLYCIMSNYIIPLDKALNEVKTILKEIKEGKIDSLEQGEIIFNKSIGLDKEFFRSQAAARVIRCSDLSKFREILNQMTTYNYPESQVDNDMEI